MIIKRHLLSECLKDVLTEEKNEPTNSFDLKEKFWAKKWINMQAIPKDKCAKKSVYINTLSIY